MALSVSGPFEGEVRRMLKSPAGILFTPPASGSKPIGPYADFDACVQANADKDDPSPRR